MYTAALYGVHSATRPRSTRFVSLGLLMGFLDAYDYYLWFESIRADGTTTSFYNSKTYEAETEFEITYMAAYFGTEFTVQVRAWNSGGYSDWTAVSTFTTPSSS